MSRPLVHWGGVCALAALSLCQVGEPASCVLTAGGSVSGWIADGAGRTCAVHAPGGLPVAVELDQRDRDLSVEQVWEGSGDRVDYLGTGPERFAVKPAPGQAWARIAIAANEKRKATSRWTLRLIGPAHASLKEAANRHTKARALSSKREWPAARKTLAEAAELWRGAGYAGGEAAAKSDMGGASRSAGNFQQSREDLEAALPLVRSSGSPWLLVECLLTLQVVLRELGALDESQTLAEEAARAAAELDSPRILAAALTSRGVLARAKGDYRAARRHHTQALDLALKAGDANYEAIIRGNVGAVLDALNEDDAAGAEFARAAELLKGPSRARVLLLLAQLHLEHGKLAEAAKAHADAEKALAGAGHKRYEAEAVLVGAMIAAAAGPSPRARSLFDDAIVRFQSLGIAERQSSAFHRRGVLETEAGQYADARKFLDRALAIRNESGIRDTAADTLYRLAVNSRRAGQLEEALRFAQEAIAAAESVRGLLRGPKRRMAYLAARHEYYGESVAAHLALHRRNPAGEHAAMALEAAERARVRTLLEQMGESAGLLAESLSPDLAARKKGIESDLQYWSSRLEDAAPSGRAAARGKVAQLLTAYADVEESLAETTRARGAAPAPLSRTELPAAIPAGNTVLEYFVGDAASALWRIDRTGIRAFELPGRIQLERLAEQYLTGAAKPGGPAPDGALLSRELLPAGLDITGPSLRIAADGILHRVPFAALPHAGKPLGEAFEVTLLPSISAAAWRAKTPRTTRYTNGGNMALIADPDYRRVGDSAPGAAVPPGRLARLGFSRREADAIVKLAKPGSVSEWYGPRASRRLFDDGSLDSARILHIAAHALVDEANPELTALALAMADERGNAVDGFLRAWEISRLRLTADLVTLSACGTGLGADIRGEGPASLARAFLNAGAGAVVMSLWPVGDAPASEFMRSFYESLLADPEAGPSAALRAAQGRVRSSPEKDHPYYWAGWNSVGGWRQ